MFVTNQRQKGKKPIITVKYGGGNMVWSCFVHLGIRKIEIIKSTICSASYQGMLDEDMRLAVPNWILKWKWVFQRNNDLQNTSKSTNEWLKWLKRKNGELWTTQSLYLLTIDILLEENCETGSCWGKPKKYLETQEFLHG